MNVTLPDGTVIRNVPEGTTKAQLVEKLRANGYDVSALSTAPKEAGERNAAVDGGNAVGTGFWRGAARMAGLPVDTVQNVLDLGKAGLGTAYHEVTGNPIPDALTVDPDRSKVVGSGDWIMKQARKSAPGRLMVDPANPDYEGGYLQAAGGSLAGGVVSPRGLPQLAHQAGMSVTSAALSKYVGDNTDNPALAVTAGMLPAATQLAAAQGVRRAVRGGEEGRVKMERRIRDLKSAGIENPTMGLASGNQMVGGLENLLQSTPGAVGTMGKARDAAIAGLSSKAAEAADMASPVRGSLESGQAIQSGVKAFREGFKNKQSALYDRMDQYIPPDQPVDVTNTRKTLANLNADIPGAPELSKQFKNGRIQAIEAAMASDTAGAPATVMVYNRPPVGGGGIMNPPVQVPPVVVQVPPGPPTNRLPFQAVKKTRTLVGNEIADTNLASSVPRSKWSPLYGALSDDMQAAADAAGPDAARAYKRANDYTRAGMNRLDRVQPFTAPDAPEQSFQLLRRTLGENASTLQALKKTIPESARGTVAGTVIERLGKATPGQQNAAGDAWSPDTFLTNWNRMDAKARRELFSGFPNADKVRADVESVANATAMMRESSRMWANPSGSGANIAARMALGLTPVSYLIDPLAAAGMATGIGTTRLLSEALTNPASVRFIASDAGLPTNTQLGLLANTAKDAGLLSQRPGRAGGLLSR